MSAQQLLGVATRAKFSTTAQKVEERSASHRQFAPQTKILGMGKSVAIGRKSTVCSAKKSGFGDDLLDFIEAGPKMRKWYGQAERGAEDDYDDAMFDDDEEEDPRPAVLVTDAESEMGQIMVLQLILQRQRIRVLVSNAERAKTGFGPYVEPFEGAPDNPASLAAALKGTKMVICCGKVGELPEVAGEVPGVEHIVLLSATGITTGASEPAIGGLFSAFSSAAAERALLRKGNREARVARGRVPYTIVRLGQYA
eukprot:CAMPEP_0118934242 /NCGR_PEP_ID=MMETSP1169-20130426/13715_1 /TAXON_ID=36882 /ORGANISM="Pyramimonas obovata, Strain CCMP722" /LENGTH=253 /DNA_ID=CAMNT_0006877123 /DNA_START=136 /DNA_END=894 /DNA_ORIENTATION=-